MRRSRAVHNPFSNNWLDVRGGDGFISSLHPIDLTSQDSISSNQVGVPYRASDFWVPEVTEDGQIFYVNTHTGKQSKDIPQEPIDDELREESSLLARSPTSRASPASYAAPALDADVTYLPVQQRDVLSLSHHDAGARDRQSDSNIRQSSSTTNNDITSWTYQESDVPPPPPYTSVSPQHRLPLVLTERPPRDRLSFVPPRTAPKAAIITRNRSYSASSSIPRPHSSALTSQARAHARKRSVGSGMMKHINSPYRTQLPTSPEHPELEEELGRTLVAMDTTPAPHSPMELYREVRQNISSVLEYLHSVDPTLFGSSQRHVIEHGIAKIITSVRNLLYVTATPLPFSLLQDEGEPSSSASFSSNDSFRSNKTMQNFLRKSSQKVMEGIANLTAADLAMQYHPDMSLNDSNVEFAITEVQRVIADFMREVQRYQQKYLIPGEHETDAKRLHGTFASSNSSLGLPGAGAAGNWKGMGYTLLPNSVTPPKKELKLDLLVEIRSLVGTVEHKLLALVTGSGNICHSAEHMHTDGQSAIAHLSSLLSVLGDVDVSRHVDITGCRAGLGNPDINAQYTRSVDRARVLVRTYEAAVDALYSDASSLLTFLQQPRSDKDVSEMYASSRRNAINSPSTAIVANLSIIVSTLESLLDVGNDQIGATHRQTLPMLKSDRRTSFISIVDGNTYPALTPVEMAAAGSSSSSLSPPTIPKNISPSPSVESSASESTLNDASMSSPDTPEDTGAEETLGPRTPSPKRNRRSDPCDSPLDSPLNDSEDDVSIEELRTTPKILRAERTSLSKSSPSSAAVVRKIFGRDAPSHIIDKLTSDSLPWFLRPHYDSSEILIEPDGKVRAGTKEALVERLTRHEKGDPTYVEHFLITFKSFMTVDELFDLLVKRFWIQPPSCLTPAESEQWQKLKQRVIQARVLNTFKSLITDEDLLEEEDKHIYVSLRNFLCQDEVIGMPAAKQLLPLLSRLESNKGLIKTRMHHVAVAPVPIVPRSKNIKLEDIDPLEIARQLTILESRTFKKITPTETLRRAREPRIPSDNISASIKLTNQIQYWIIECILSRSDNKKRAAIVKHVIHVADRCRQLNNFSSMMAVTGALNNTAIRRLKRTWDLISGKYISILSLCESIVTPDRNFSNYWQALKTATPPCLPFVGQYLSVLQFINDGANDKAKESERMINFQKRQRAAEIILSIRRYQEQPYNFRPVAVVLSYLEESFNRFGEGIDYSDQFWKLSLEREPKEREDEKVARILHETGFI
ncbi:hypothetical protein ABKN59_006142 [Abortiporus biennis]